MRIRSDATRRSAAREALRQTIAALAIFVVSLGAVAAPPATRTPAAGDAIAIDDEALPALADAAIREGRDLEARGLWGEAIAHYEQALRKYPADRRLKRRFDIARLHTSLERRYADPSFSESLAQLDARAALDVHAELLSKIESHYVVNPPWAKLTHRGATAVLVAAGDPEFCHRHRLQPTEAQLRQLGVEFRERLAKTPNPRNSREALRVATDLTRLAEARLRLPGAVWTMEFVAAAAGALDTYSAYLTPGQLREVYSQIEGNFVGLGVELKADRGALLIVRVIPGSPAQRAGIREGDRITAVDGQQTADLTTDQAAALLTGEEGSMAYVTVESPDESGDVAELASASNAVASRRTLRVRREHVDVPSIERADICDSDYGVAYVRVPVFQKSTSRDVESALWDLHRRGMRSLIIDLRGNPGGLLTSSVELADKFIAQGNIVSTRGRSDGEDFDYRAHRAGTWRVPLVVLIDEDSASASEIFAAAIRDNARGTVVGVRSYGKGSVQGIFPMTRSGAGIRLTTAKFYSPEGRPISKVGVDPDIVVRRATSTAPGERGVRQTVGYRGGAAGASDADADRALSKAIEVARQKVAMR